MIPRRWRPWRSLFGRTFLTTVAISVGLLLLAGAVWFSQAWHVLDDEAGRRLESAARLAAAEMGRWQRLGGEDPEVVLAGVVGRSLEAGWVQNAYWLEIEDGRPRVVALLSASDSARASVAPPTVDELDDLLDLCLPRLEEGRPAHPDPAALGGGRQFRIVLQPYLDDDGLLTHVVGLEADLSYLEMRHWFAGSVWRVAGLAVLVSLMAAALVARGWSRRIGVILGDLERVARREVPEPAPLGIDELDRLRQGVATLGGAIVEGDRRLAEAFERRTAELAFTGAAIAHEIRNPLAAIEMHLALVRRLLAEQPAAAAPCREILDNLATMRTLAERFLAYSRRVEPRLEPVGLVAWLGEVVTEWQRRQPAIRWRLQHPPREVPGQLDRLLMRQVIDNLLDNAVAALSASSGVSSRPADPDGTGAGHAGSAPAGPVAEGAAGFSPPGRSDGRDDGAGQVAARGGGTGVVGGGDPPLAEVIVAIEVVDGMVRLTVTDSGPGVADDLVPRLFTPFASGRAGGNGIGLALVRKLVEAHRGRVSYRRGVSGGAAFSIELPLAGGAEGQIKLEVGG